MQLNHLNLTVTDVEANRLFLEHAFGLTSFPSQTDAIAILTDNHGLILTLMRGKEVSYPRSFHIGFHQDTDHHVDLMYERLRAEGITIDPPTRQHGAWTFYVPAPGGFGIEVFHQSNAPTS